MWPARRPPKHPSPTQPRCDRPVGASPLIRTHVDAVRSNRPRKRLTGDVSFLLIEDVRHSPFITLTCHTTCKFIFLLIIPNSFDVE